MKTHLLFVLALVTLLLMSVTPVFATPPIKTSFEIEIDEIDPALSELCGFDVRVAGTLKITETLFFDQDGAPSHVKVHVLYHNGTVTNLETSLTLRDPGAFNVTIDLNDGTIVETGMHFAITVPGEGVVVLDAGRLVAVDGELVFEAGPHFQLNQGDSIICDALS